MVIAAHFFPVPKGNNPIRTGSYPTQIFVFDFFKIKFKNQNPGLVLNMFGWHNNDVIVHMVSERPKHCPRINLMLVTQGEKQHYILVKRLSVLLMIRTNIDTEDIAKCVSMAFQESMSLKSTKSTARE